MEYNYHFNLNDPDLDFSIKKKYEKILFNISKNSHYTSIIEEIVVMENKYLNDTEYDILIHKKKKLIQELNKKSKEFYKNIYCIEYSEDDCSSFISVLDTEYLKYGIVLDIGIKNKIDFIFFV